MTARTARTDRSGLHMVLGICAVLPLALLAGVVRNAVTGHTSAATTAPAQDVAYSSFSFGLDCQKQVEAALKAPATAAFERPLPVRRTDAGGYAMSSYVDSENSFGAKLRTRFVCSSAPGLKAATALILE